MDSLVSEGTNQVSTTGGPAVPLPEPSGGDPGFFSQLGDSITQTTPRILLAALILVGGWIAARLLSKALFVVLTKTRIDDWASKQLGVDTGGKYGHRVERFLARVLFFAVMILVVVLALDVLPLDPINEPLRHLVNEVGAALPNVLLAAIIVALAFVIGKLVGLSVTKGLQAAQFDERMSRFGGLTVEERSPSKSLGSLAFWFIMIIGAIQGLAALQLRSLVAPLQGALNELAAALPNIIAALILLALGVLLARFVGRLCANLLTKVGFNRFVYRILPIGPSEPTDAEGEGDGEAEPEPSTEAGAEAGAEGTGPEDEGDEDGKAESSTVTPSSVTGQVITVLIALLIVLQVLSMLDLDRLARLLEQFMSVFLPNLAVAGAILVFGIWAGTWAKDQIDGLYGDHDARPLRMLGSFTRVAVLVFAVAMGLQQLGVAAELINTAFAILFGALCLALALAFGLGGREVAGEVVRNEYTRYEKPEPKPKPKRTTRKTTKTATKTTK